MPYKISKEKLTEAINYAKQHGDKAAGLKFGISRQHLNGLRLGRRRVRNDVTIKVAGGKYFNVHQRENWLV